MTTLRVPEPSGGPGLTPVSNPSLHHRVSAQPSTASTPPGLPGFSFRRPRPPYPIEPFDIRLPTLPSDLDGLRILHITDLHVRRLTLRTGIVARVLDALRATPADLVLLTGDYADKPGHEPAAVRTIDAFARAWRSRLGAAGIFGNHDSAAMRQLARQVNAVRWIENGPIDIHNAPIRILGASYPEDIFSAALARSNHDRFEIALVHDPAAAIAAAELGVPLAFAGHTHGGQVRFSRTAIPHTSSDLPRHLATGVLRVRDTLCCVSRGIGHAIIPLRLNCPPHMPLYTLRRGPLPEPEHPDAPHCLVRW